MLLESDKSPEKSEGFMGDLRKCGSSGLAESGLGEEAR